MAFVAYRTWVTAEIVTAAMLNQDIRNNGRFLHGDDGAITLENALIIDNSLGTEYLTLPALTTAQRDALTPTDGMTIFNTTLDTVQTYDGAAAAWVEQVHIPIAAAAGDIPYRAAAKWAALAAGAQGAVPYMGATSVPAWLGVGTSGQFLQTKGAAANPVWASGNNTIAGTYTGDGADNRQITTGFQCHLVVVHGFQAANFRFWVCIHQVNSAEIASGSVSRTDVLLHATDGFVVDNVNANTSGVAYAYTAVG